MLYVSLYNCDPLELVLHALSVNYLTTKLAQYGPQIPALEIASSKVLPPPHVLDGFPVTAQLLEIEILY